MEKKQFEGVIFDGRADEDYKKKFKTYINNLPIPNFPFNCSNLRVLHEAIKLINTYGPSNTFEKGALICDYNVQRDLSYECGINSELKLGGNSNLIFECLREGRVRKFEVKLVDFCESG